MKLNSRATGYALICLCSLPAFCLRAQEQPPESFTEEMTTESTPNAPPLKRYNIPWGSGGVNLSAGLRGVYVDNVFLTHTGTSDDFVIVPEVDVAAFFPIGQSNTVVIDVGIAYDYYTKNTSLNSSAPLINPNSELAFNIRSGDFTFRPSEKFSYQESPVYDYGGQFYNVYNSGRFARFNNIAGLLVTWDQHDLVTSAGYFHENLWANGSTYNYIDHSSELFNADAILTINPWLKTGVEGFGSINNFDNTPLYDTWRARVGPTFRMSPSRFIKIRLGAGYERIEYDSSEAPTFGLTPENTYYAYGSIEHQINQFMSHTLEASHDNQLGFNAANLEGTHLSYFFTWHPRQRLTLSPRVSVGWYNESFGSSASTTLYHETFTYVLAGFSALYEFDKHWQAHLSWDYRLKDSDIVSDGYAQNQVAIELLYRF